MNHKQIHLSTRQLYFILFSIFSQPENYILCYFPSIHKYIFCSAHEKLSYSGTFALDKFLSLSLSQWFLQLLISFMECIICLSCFSLILINSFMKLYMYLKDSISSNIEFIADLYNKFFHILYIP